MGWACIHDPFFEPFVAEVVEPAGKPPRSKTSMVVHGVEPCSLSGCQVAYAAREVVATRAEAEKVAAAARAGYQAWLKERDERKAARAAARRAEHYAKRVHFPTQSYIWRRREYFREARKKGLALCETWTRSGSKIITEDPNKVTCENCLRQMRPEQRSSVVQ